MMKKDRKYSRAWSADGVPQWFDRKGERTIPQAIAHVGGTSHAQLRALAAGSSPALILSERYLVERCIGHGGMATVYAGRLLSLDRPVAIKILNDAVASGSDNRYARFVAEARMTSSLDHHNIIEVFDFGSTQDGVMFMVMELLEGEDLKALVRRSGPLSWLRVQVIMQDICAGLGAVHRAGLVHRDLKPANCFVTSDSTKLIDFGIATKATVGSSAALMGPSPLGPGSEEDVTEGGAILGTPEYMSPEQAQGWAVDARSDVYSAGILLGVLLTGRLPFESGPAKLVIRDQICKPAPSLLELAGDGVWLDPAVVTIYARALHKHPDERFATVEALGAALASATTPQRVNSPAWSLQMQAGLISERHSTFAVTARRQTQPGSTWGRRRRARTWRT